MALHIHIRRIAQALHEIAHTLTDLSEELTPAVDPGDEAARIERVRALKLDELELSVRLSNCLKNASLFTIGDVMDDNLGTHGTWKQIPHASTIFQVLFAGGIDRELLMRMLPGGRRKAW